MEAISLLTEEEIIIIDEPEQYTSIKADLPSDPEIRRRPIVLPKKSEEKTENKEDNDTGILITQENRPVVLPKKGEERIENKEDNDIGILISQENRPVILPKKGEERTENKEDNNAKILITQGKRGIDDNEEVLRNTADKEESKGKEEEVDDKAGMEEEKELIKRDVEPSSTKRRMEERELIKRDIGQNSNKQGMGEKRDLINRDIEISNAKDPETSDVIVNLSPDTVVYTEQRNRRKEEERIETAIVEETKQESNNEERLPDGGWGWVVVFGASLILVLVDTIGQCFGIIFSRFLLQLETSTIMSAWIFNLFSFIWCLTGPPLGPLITEFGWRSLTILGSILLAIATITSAFVTAAWVLFFTYSLLAGMGCGIISNISYMIVPNYFTTRRGMANGIIMAWDCGGQLIGPPLIQILQDEYTFTGATLILGGVILNCCVGAAVFHPVEWHLKPRTCRHRALVKSQCESLEPRISRTSKTEETLEFIQSPCESLKPRTSSTSKTEETLELIQSPCESLKYRTSSSSKTEDTLELIQSPCESLKPRTSSTSKTEETLEIIQCARKSLKPRTSGTSKTEENLELIQSPCESLTKAVVPPESQWKVFLRLIKLTMDDLLILKSARAMIIAVGATFIFSGYLNFLAFMPFSMQEAGYSLEDAATCVSVSAICNMTTRVIIANLSDTKRFNFQISMMVGSLTISGTMVCFTLLNDLTLMKMVMGLWGFGVGTFMSIFNLTMVHYMGLDKLMPMLGSSMLFIAFGYLTIGPFAGYVRDVTESYAVCIWILAAVVFSSFVLWLFMPMAVAYDLRKEGKKNKL